MTLILPQLGPVQARLAGDEQKRLEELYSMGVLDASSDARFDYYTELATNVLKMPMASVVLVDKEKLVFKSVRGRSVSKTPRDLSFAAHTFSKRGLLIVPDAAEDGRFSHHPLVRNEPHIRFYAGGAIRGPSGQPLGAISVMDRMPRQFLEEQQKILLQLMSLLEHEMQTRASIVDLRAKIREHALFDPVTRLPNHSLFMTQLAKIIGSSDSRPFVVALIRLERYEAIHGAVGDAGAAHLVRDAASRLRSVLSASSLIGQYREDTMEAVFEASDAASASTTIRKLLDCFRAPFVLGDHMIVLRLSIGASLYPNDARDPATLIKRARTALHSATVPTDTSSYRLYDRRLSARAARNFEIEGALKGALERKELRLAYQPQVCLGNHRLAGAEALMRWTSGKLGAVSPAEFVPIAEQSGLIIDLGAWVLDAACRQTASWVKAGYSFPEMSINLSIYQLRNPGFCDQVRRALQRASLEGSRLNLEITEGTLIENMGEVIEVMHRLRELGVTFSIDDFGKGFSSLSYLKEMPVQALKIDRHFVERIPRDHNDLKLVRSIIAMGHALDLRVVAEGVETKEQIEVLRSARCDQIQGFIFGRPVSEARFAREFLQTDRSFG
jgi:diguanylate cyclase (GGDEF)-like protein